MKHLIFVGILFLFISHNTCHSCSCEESSEGNEDKTWKEGKIRFGFSDDFKGQDRETWSEAAKYVEDRTCVKFIQGSGTDVDLYVKNDDNTHSCIGRAVQGQQAMCFQSEEKLYVYKRNFGHLLGLPLEQNRQDRDDFIVFNKGKTCDMDGLEPVESGLPKAAMDTMLDYTSLMATQTECYKPKDGVAPEDIPLGPSSEDDYGNEGNFSVVDIDRINALYDCGDCYSYRFKLNTHNNTPIPIGKESNGEDIYACRVYHEGHLLIGNYRPHHNGGKCLVSLDGPSKEYTEMFEVLENPNHSMFTWVDGGDFRLPWNAVRGGRTKDRVTIYIARCNITEDGHTLSIPGFVLESYTNEARIATKDGTKICDEFEYYYCASEEKDNPYGRN